MRALHDEVGRYLEGDRDLEKRRAVAAEHAERALEAAERALGAGDEETATRLGLLSLLEEDVALADYVLAEGGTLMAQLRALLDRIRTEAAA